VAHVESAAVVRPKFGETVSGDAAFTMATDTGLLATVIDVVGHGKEAHELAVRMQEHLLANASGTLVEILSRLHEKYRGSRGASVGLCLVEPAHARLRFAGIGNTVTRRFGMSESQLVSRDGVVGGTMRLPVETTISLSDGDVIVMYTDGVRAHFDASAYPRLQSDTPHAVAANIVHRFSKWHDDASCVAIRYHR
jgi:hypothetical protein